MLGFVRRLFSAETGSVEKQDVCSAETFSVVLPGRVFVEPSLERMRQEASELAVFLFGRRLVRAPSGWFLAPCAGIVSGRLVKHCSLAGQSDFVVSLAPGWALGVLAELSPRFLIIEAQALYEGQWAGALEPGGEHLFDELLALVEMAKEQQVVPVFLDNAGVVPGVEGSLARLKKAVPAVINADFLLASQHTTRSEILQRLCDYWQLSQEQEG